MDDEIFIASLHQLMKELPSAFRQWDLLLECLELCLVEKREERQPVVSSLLRSLFLSGLHSPGHAVPILSFLHGAILRYPRQHSSLSLLHLAAQREGKSAVGKKEVEEDDPVADMAMKVTAPLVSSSFTSSSQSPLPLTHSSLTAQALREHANDPWEAERLDGSFSLNLLMHHSDPRIAHLAKLIGQPSPLPFRKEDASEKSFEPLLLQRLEYSLQWAQRERSGRKRKGSPDGVIEWKKADTGDTTFNGKEKREKREKTEKRGVPDRPRQAIKDRVGRKRPQLKDKGEAGAANKSIKRGSGRRR